MKVMIAFVMGVVVGAIASLLLAPKSGEELRTELRQEASAERERARKEYAHAVEQVQQRVDKVQSDVQGMLAQVNEKGKGATGTETAVSPE